MLGLLASPLIASSAPAQYPLLNARETGALARLLRIEDTHRDEPAFVDSLLEHAGPRLRARAALAAGRVGARIHLAAIRREALATDDAVAGTAWFALALLHDSASASAAIAHLHSPVAVATQAARFLGEIGAFGRSGILAGLADSTLDAAVRGELLLSAARLRPFPTSAITPWLASPDSAMAWRATYALGRARSAAAVRPLLALSGSPMSAVREQAARGIGRAVAGDSLGDSAFVLLTTLIRDSVTRVRVNAARSLATYGGRARASLLPALRDGDAGVRLTAAQSLGSVLDSTSAPWLDALTEDTALVFQSAILDAAASRRVVLPMAKAWRSSSDWHRRVAALAVEAHGTADSIAQRLRAWLRDGDPRVRAAAASALATVLDSALTADTARAILRVALADPDVFVRAAALGGLTRRSSAADLELAIDAYARSRDDRDADARLAFWPLVDSALARVGDMLPESTRRRLAALLRPSDPLERIAASHISRFAAWADSSGRARTLTWYEARAREVSYHPQRTARVETDRGVMTVALYAWDAPLTVFNFRRLADRHYFDGQRFHRVVPNFVVQAGDPRGDGNGGPGYAIRDEINLHHYGRGTLGMALSGPDTGGSQFFIAHSPQPHLDGGYTVFGQLQRGYDTLDRIVQGDRIVRVTVR